MHGFTNIVVATERERQVTHPTADMRAGKIFLNPSGSFNEVHGIVVMFFDSRSYGKHIGVEDYIMGIKIDFINQKTVCALAYFYLTGGSIRLAFSSKAMTTAAAPYCLIVRACSRNTSSPLSKK